MDVLIDVKFCNITDLKKEPDEDKVWRQHTLIFKDVIKFPEIPTSTETPGFVPEFDRILSEAIGEVLGSVEKELHAMHVQLQAKHN
jgi:hypothetical protein